MVMKRYKDYSGLYYWKDLDKKIEKVVHKEEKKPEERVVKPKKKPKTTKKKKRS